MAAPRIVLIPRGTGVFADENRRVRDVAPTIARLEPNETPMTTFMMRMQSRVATDPKIEWFEHEVMPRFTSLTSALGAGDATMDVADPTFLRSGDIVRVNQGEIVRVTATPAANPVAITRSIGITPAAAAAVGNQLHLLSNSSPEGADKRDLLAREKDGLFNFLQIIRDPFGYTQTAGSTKVYGEHERDEQRNEFMLEHKRSQEFAFLLGEKSEVTDPASNQPLRTTQGIIPEILTNIVDAGGTLTEAEFEGWLRRMFRFGPERTRIIFTAANVLTVINGFARAKLQTIVMDKLYGVTITRYQSAGRNVLLVEHKLLENALQTDLTGLAGTAIGLDMSDITLRYLTGRLTNLIENIQNPGEDARRDEYLSEVGLEAKLEKKHGVLTGVTD